MISNLQYFSKDCLLLNPLNSCIPVESAHIAQKAHLVYGVLNNNFVAANLRGKGATCFRPIFGIRAHCHRKRAQKRDPGRKNPGLHTSSHKLCTCGSVKIPSTFVSYRVIGSVLLARRTLQTLYGLIFASQLHL